MAKRFLAEWEPQSAIMMALPHEQTDWNYILDEALNQYHRIVKCFTENNVKVILLCKDIEASSELFKDCKRENLMLVEMDFNDTWTRDYGPLAIEKDDRLRALDFGFNGWGLKFASDKDNLVNLSLHNKGLIADSVYRNNRDFVLEGGSVESNGIDTVLTTTRCLCSPNRNGGKSKSEISDILSERLGVSHVLWLDYGALEGDDTDSHIDTLVRMAPNDTIVFTGCRDVDDSHFEELLHLRAQLTLFRTAEGTPFNLVELPLPDAVYDEDGNRLPATYANYLVTNKAVFVPTYSCPEKDMLATRTLKIVFPDHEIIGIDCVTLLKQHGSLHCATMQLHPGEFVDIL